MHPLPAYWRLAFETSVTLFGLLAAISCCVPLLDLENFLRRYDIQNFLRRYDLLTRFFPSFFQVLGLLIQLPGTHFYLSYPRVVQWIFTVQFCHGASASVAHQDSTPWYLQTTLSFGSAAFAQASGRAFHRCTPPPPPNDSDMEGLMRGSFCLERALWLHRTSSGFCHRRARVCASQRLFFGGGVLFTTIIITT